MRLTLKLALLAASFCIVLALSLLEPMVIENSDSRRPDFLPFLVGQQAQSAQQESAPQPPPPNIRHATQQEPQQAGGQETTQYSYSDEPPPVEEPQAAPPSVYLTTSRFIELSATADLSSRTTIRKFQSELTSSKGMLSFAEFCYLQGRVDFAARDYSAAARLFRQITDVPGFIDAHPDVLYYLGVILERDRADRQAAAGFYRDYIQKARAGDQLLPQAQEALHRLGTTPPRAATPKSGTGFFGASGVNFFKGPDPQPRTAPHTTSNPQQESGPKFSLHLADREVMLDELGERMLLLHFWASWCLPCAQELPLLIAFLGDGSFQRQSQVKPLLITVDRVLGEGSHFLKLRALTVKPLYWDPQELLLKDLTGKMAIPATVLYDSRERAVVKIYPQLKWNEPTVKSDILEAAARYLRSHPVHNE